MGFVPLGRTKVCCVRSLVLQEARAYYEQTGVGLLPVVLFNGMPLDKEQLDPDELETVTMHRILETTIFFQRAVYLVSGLVCRLVSKRMLRVQFCSLEWAMQFCEGALFSVTTHD